jgi:hypothetical protein
MAPTSRTMAASFGKIPTTSVRVQQSGEFGQLGPQLVEHRLFAFITQNWRGKPLIRHQVIIQLLGATTTRTGLDVQCRLDANKYPKGIRVSDRELAAIDLEHNSFRGEWNYTISLILSKHSCMQTSPSLSKDKPRLAKDD